MMFCRRGASKCPKYTAHEEEPSSSCRTILRARIIILDRWKKFCAYEKYTPGVLSSTARKVSEPLRRQQLRDVPYFPKRFEEARSLLRKTMPVARRVLGKSDELMFKMNQIYARALCQDPGAHADDLREAVTKLEDVERTARQVLGGAHGSQKVGRRTARQRVPRSPPANPGASGSSWSTSTHECRRRDQCHKLQEDL